MSRDKIDESSLDSLIQIMAAFVFLLLWTKVCLSLAEDI